MRLRTTNTRRKRKLQRQTAFAVAMRAQLKNLEKTRAQSRRGELFR